jgi:hypothetical protein
MLFLLKVAVSPILVALVSVAARWWGPMIGGVTTAFVLGTVSALPVSAVLLALNRWRTVR